MPSYTPARKGRSTAPDPLQRYWAKRDFGKTPEPRGTRGSKGKLLSFVIQKHAATRLHYDFRLELDGVLLSWAVPKGPSYDPAAKRMAVRTEDHPLSYASFEGSIPAQQYGAGTVIVWDRGTWEPVGDPRDGLAQGKLVFNLHGQKMAGLWELVRIQKPGERQEPWILFKKRDSHARPHTEYDVVTALPDSVIAKPLEQPASSGRQAKPERAVATKVQGKEQLPGAVKAPIPAKLAPQLASLASGIPAQGEWSYEIKFDGYRLLTRIEQGKARLFTRNGHDWTAKMPVLAKELEGLGLKSAWLDGEIVVVGESGAPDFNALQNAFDGSRTQPIVCFLFDVPYFEGYDLRGAPLYARRELLKRLLDEKSSEHVRFSADFAADARSVLESACKLHLEGVIAKRLDAPYRSERTETWLKLKCRQRQEFVVGGFTDRVGAAAEVGSLLLGVHEDGGKLVHAGSVGTGWDSKTAQDLYRRLVKLETSAAPFDAASLKKGRWSKRAAGSERWVKPGLIVEVSYAEWTPGGQIRHATYVGVRTDKPARAIVREHAVSMIGGANAPTSANPAAASIKVSNPERVIDPSTGLKKLDLVRYYESVAGWILPHLKGRPVSLVRGPTGITGELFFQKHGEKIGIPGIKELPAALWPGHDALLEVATGQALLGAAQMNVIEFHTWNSTAKNIDKPDRMIFDLDPGEGVNWSAIQEAALLTHALLDQLGLQSWLKTSGGKGLHVVVPLAQRLDYTTVKDFSQAIVQHLARTIPSRFVARSGPANRVGKIFVDYLRNGHGATTATAFSARARPGLGVSMPVSWGQLSSLKSGAQWTIATAREHLSFQSEDPWSGYWSAKQGLVGPMKMLGFSPPPRVAKR